MSITLKRTILSIASVGALVLAGCGTPPAGSANSSAAGSAVSASPGSSSGGAASGSPGASSAGGSSGSAGSSGSGASGSGSQHAAAGFMPCIVSDSGGFNDHSYNQLGLQGVEQAAKEFGVPYKAVQSKTLSDYAPNLTQMVNEHCSIIITSINMVPQTKIAAQANPNTDFVTLDDDTITLPNVKPVVFSIGQASFLGGYAAAAYSKTGTVGEYGGQEIAPVTLYMDGFWDGVQYYNKQNKKNVKVLGWNEQTQKGTFVGNFTDQNASKTIAANMLGQGADVLVCVAGPLYEGTGAEIRATGSKAVLEGVDADLFETDTNGYQNILLTSILKNLQPTVVAVLSQAASGQPFTNAPYIGTLANNGVGLASFHDFASKIPATLPAQLDAVKAGIIDGSIPVASPVKVTG